MARKPAQTEMPKIEKGVPLPDLVHRKTKYPFRAMEPGDSIIVVGKNPHSYAISWSQRTGWKFISHDQPDGTRRVWRLS